MVTGINQGDEGWNTAWQTQPKALYSGMTPSEEWVSLMRRPFSHTHTGPWSSRGLYLYRLETPAGSDSTTTWEGAGAGCFSTLPASSACPPSSEPPHALWWTPGCPQQPPRKSCEGGKKCSRGIALRNVFFSQEIYLPPDKGAVWKTNFPMLCLVLLLAFPLSAPLFLSHIHIHAFDDTTV